MNLKSNNQWFQAAIGLLGGLAISAGILFLIGEMFGIHLVANFWPVFIVVPGVALFVVALFLDEGIGLALSIVGGITTMSGLILFVHSLTGYWATWPYSWTLLFPTSIGLSMLAYGMVKNRPDLRRTGWNLSKIGLALFLVFAVFFEFILGLGGFGLQFGWPLLLMSLGILLFTLRGTNLNAYEPVLAKEAGANTGIDK